MRLRLSICCVALVACAWLLMPAGSSGAASPKRAQDLREKIDRTRDKIQRRRGTERVLTGDIAAYTRRIQRLQREISTLQSRQARFQADLDAKRAELARIQADLRRERARLARLRARLTEARGALAVRLREIYKAEEPDALTVIFKADGFAELLSRGEFLKRVSDQDSRIVTIVRDAKADSVRTAARLDRLESRQQRVTRTIEQRRNDVAATKATLVDRRAGYRRTQAGKKRALSSTRRDRAGLEEHLRELEAEESKVVAALRRAQGGAGGGIRRGSGNMIWPVNGRISSPFGMRWGRLHAGVDIPGTESTPIRAADSGRVVIMGFTGGYGNYTCIQHSGSLSTCYAHQSRYATRKGASVRKGQVIGYVGNTGHSFGAHLHFEVRVNGSPVNPMGYL